MLMKFFFLLWNLLLVVLTSQSAKTEQKKNRNMKNCLGSDSQCCHHIKTLHGKQSQTLGIQSVTFIRAHTDLSAEGSLLCTWYNGRVQYTSHINSEGRVPCKLKKQQV